MWDFCIIPKVSRIRLGTRGYFGKKLKLGYTFYHYIDLVPRVQGNDVITAMHCQSSMKILSGRWCQKCIVPLYTFSRNAQPFFINFDHTLNICLSVTKPVDSGLKKTCKRCFTGSSLFSLTGPHQQPSSLFSKGRWISIKDGILDVNIPRHALYSKQDFSRISRLIVCALQAQKCLLRELTSD